MQKIKKFIKENYKIILIYLFLFIFFTYRLPFYIYVGGGTIDLKNRIDLETNETGSYNLAYVKQINATIPTYLLSFFIDKWKVESIDNSKIDDSEDTSDITAREKLYLEEANNHAIINAYKLANKKITITDNSYKVIYISDKSNTNVQVGDKLISVNGVSINNNSEYKKYLNTIEVDTKLNIKVLRNNQEVDCYGYLKEIDGEKIIGLYLVNIYDYEVEPEINLKFKWYESGPSGGFMLSLAIYDRLIEEDLTKGRVIVGTGTIDAVGNIGEIGGISYKIMGAAKNKADIFFCPVANYEEAIKTKNKYNYHLTIIKVETLEDAVNYLKNN